MIVPVESMKAISAYLGEHRKLRSLALISMVVVAIVVAAPWVCALSPAGLLAFRIIGGIYAAVLLLHLFKRRIWHTPIVRTLPATVIDVGTATLHGEVHGK